MHALSLLLYIAGCCLVAATGGEARKLRNDNFLYVAPSYVGPEPQSQGLSEPLILLEDVPTRPFYESLSSAAEPARNLPLVEEQEGRINLERDDERASNSLQSSGRSQPRVNSASSVFDFKNSEGFFQRNKGPQFGVNFLTAGNVGDESSKIGSSSVRNVKFGLDGVGKFDKQEGGQSFKIESSLPRGFQPGPLPSEKSDAVEESRGVRLDGNFESGFSQGGVRTELSPGRQFFGTRNQSPLLPENSFQFALGGSSSGNTLQLPKLDGFSVTNEAGRDSSSLGRGSSFNFFIDGGSNERKVFESSSSALPQSFTPGAKFVPPTYDPELDKKERSESNFLDGIDSNAAVAIDRADCIPETVTVHDTFTSLVPVTTEILSTVSLTSAFTHTRTEIVTVRSTSTLTNSVKRTQVATVFSTIHRVSTQTKFVSPTTLFSTFTSVVTDYFDKVVVSTQTDTIVVKTTSYVTITDSRVSTTTVPVPHYTTAYAQVPAFVRSFPLTKTETVTKVSTLPAQIVYNSQTLQKTETLTATQTLQPKTVIRTKTVIVPSYSTIYTTSTQTRTKTLRSTVPIIQTTTATSISSIFRVGVAANTEYSTVTETVSSVQYFTTQVPRYITVSITSNIPETTTRTTTIFGGVQRTVTAPGAIVTEYHTRTSYYSVYKTVTNTLTTPIVYATQTVTLNCPHKK